MLKEILIKAREHPLQAFTWTVLTLCVGYLGHREVTFPDTADSFEKSRLELSVAQMEYDRVGKILAIYHETDQNIQVLIKRADDLVNQKFPEITASDIQDVRALQVQARQEFTKFLAVIRNAHFDNPSFTELIQTVDKDAVYRDTFISKRIEFLDLIVADLNKANEIAPTIFSSVEEQRKLFEMSAREPFFDYTLEKAREEFNAKVRTAKRKESLFKAQSRLAIAAWIYIGAFVGGWVPYLFATWRRQKKSSSFERLD